jgi:hypothetical protein
MIAFAAELKSGSVGAKTHSESTKGQCQDPFILSRAAGGRMSFAFEFTSAWLDQPDHLVL